MTDEQIEAAAKAGWGYELIDVPWEKASAMMRAAHLSRAKSMLDAAERVVWQPIESAPEEGYVVLIARYPSGCGWTDQYQAWWGAGQWVRWPHGFQPTHWRPMPDPPYC